MFINMKLSAKQLVVHLNKDIFTISAISFIVFFFIELIKPKFVIAYLNLSYLLLICLLSGIFAILNKGEDKEEVEEEEKMSVRKLLLLSIVIFIFLMLFLAKLGGWGILISLTGGLVVFLLGVILINE